MQLSERWRSRPTRISRWRAGQPVIVGALDGYVRLSVDDDGQGFPFSGRLAQAELDRLRRGPQVIKERTRAAGGELTVESTPGRGSRLAITFR